MTATLIIGRGKDVEECLSNGRVVITNKRLLIMTYDGSTTTEISKRNDTAGNTLQESHLHYLPFKTETSEYNIAKSGKGRQPHRTLFFDINSKQNTGNSFVPLMLDSLVPGIMFDIANRATATSAVKWNRVEHATEKVSCFCCGIPPVYDVEVDFIPDTAVPFISEETSHRKIIVGCKAVPPWGTKCYDIVINASMQVPLSSVSNFVVALQDAVSANADMTSEELKQYAMQS